MAITFKDFPKEIMKLFDDEVLPSDSDIQTFIDDIIADFDKEE